MNKSHIIKIVFLFGLAFFAFQTRSAGASPVQQSSNLLTNPGFEGSYDGDGSANGWSRWFRPGQKTDNCEDGFHVEPRWGRATDFVSEGSTSQFIGTNWVTWKAGLFQRVSVTPGSTYRFSFQARGRTSMEPAPSPSANYINMNIRAGADLAASGDWHNVTVEGGYGSPHDQWQQFSVEFTASGSQVDVYILSDLGVPGVNQCLQFLSTYYDQAELVEVGPPPTNTPIPQPTSPPPPPATATPVPTATTVPTATPVPTDTPVPTATFTPTPAGGTICVNAFADENGNGTHDATEGYMAGVTFTVASASQAIGQAVSPGTDTPVCFDGLEPGSYQVAQTVPSRLEMTTAASAMLQVEQGRTFGVEFGSRIRTAPAEPTIASSGTSSPDTIASDTVLPTAVPTGDDTATSDSRLSLLAIGGLAIIGLAIILLGALIFMVLRRAA